MIVIYDFLKGKSYLIYNFMVWFNPLWCFFGSEGHVALDRNPGPGYDTLLLRMIPDLLSAFPHRQFHTLPSLLDSWAALPNSNPNACVPMQGGSLYHFYDGLWYDPAERRTHDLPCERRTRYRLSQPDTLNLVIDLFEYIYQLIDTIHPLNNIIVFLMVTFASSNHHYFSI